MAALRHGIRLQDVPETTGVSIPPSPELTSLLETLLASEKLLLEKRQRGGVAAESPVDTAWIIKCTRTGSPPLDALVIHRTAVTGPS